jgi:hypothetical protein
MVQVQRFYGRADARVRVQFVAGFVLGAESSKNHDEPINYTVRVMVSCYFPIKGLSKLLNY